MFPRMLSYCLLAGTIIAGMPMVSSVVARAESAVAPFTIPAQDLSTALTALARQSGRNLLYTPEMVVGRRSVAVERVAEFTVALETMLASSGLRPVMEPDGSVTLVRAADPAPLPARTPARSVPRPEAAAEGLVLEEILVTAQKRAEPLEFVPAALAVVGGEEASARGITDVTRLVDEVPGLSINYAFGGANYGLLSIRGIGGADDYKPNGNPSVALHVDGIYQTSNAYLGTPLFDIERIEVLKGPQGTLYGRNTTAGVINVITKAPGDRLEGYVDVKAGSYGYTGFEGAVGGPVSDKIGIRLAVFGEQGGGFMDGKGAGRLAGFRPSIGGKVQTQVPAITDPGERNGFGDKDLFAARGTVTLDLAEETRLTLRGFGSRDRGDSRQYDRLALAQDNTVMNAGEDADPYSFYASEYYSHHIDVTSLSGTLEHRLADDLNLTVLAGWQESSRKGGGNGDGTPYPGYQFDFDDRLSQVSFEVRVGDDRGGSFDWLVGAFYVSDDVDFDSVWTSFTVLSVYKSPYAQSRDSTALFGQGDWNISDSLRLSAGLRYTRDNADFRGQNEDLNPWGISTFNKSFATISPFSWDRSFDDDNLSGRLTAQWFVNDEVNLFASYGTGYRGGGFDGTSIFTLEETLPFDSETVEAVEGGVRWTRDRIRVSLDGFAYWFKDMQATTRLANDTNGRTNVGRATSRGVEASIQARLLQMSSHTLDVNVSAAYLDTEITEFTSNRSADVKATVGDPLPGAPDITANLSLVHRAELGAGWALGSRVGVSHHGKESNRLNALPNNTAEAYTLVDMRMELTAPGDWSVYVYGRNITDEVYFPELNGAARLVGEPATWGAGLRYRF